MTAPVAPMEARCAVCLDTGSKSKWTGGDLDCTACDAAEKRGALYATVEAALKVATAEYRLASFDAVWLAYQLGQAAPVAAQSAMPKLPSTPEEMVSFIGSHFDNVRDADDLANVKFQVSVHDLMSCFRDWFDLNEVGEQPAQPEEIDFLAMGWASDAETESLRAAIAAQEPKQAMTDAEIEELAIQRGGRWDGNTWVFEDADLHPFARAILAASSPNKELVEALQRVEQELIKLEHAVGGGDGEIYVEGAILTCQAALRAAGVEVA